MKKLGTLPMIALFTSALALAACGGPLEAGEAPEAVEVDAAAPEVGTSQRGLCGLETMEFWSSYCFGLVDAPYAGQCIGQNVLIQGFCLNLDPSSPDFGCGLSCGGY